MDDYYKRCQIPAFGSWDCYDNGLPFTQCFETARRAGFLRYSYSGDRDLYVAGDLYSNDAVTPSMIVVPRRKKAKSGTKKGDYDDAKESKETRGWVVRDLKESPSQNYVRRPTPKPVDEDLYKISPDLLYAKAKIKKKRSVLSFFSCCVLPTCAL